MFGGNYIRHGNHFHFVPDPSMIIPNVCDTDIQGMAQFDDFVDTQI